MPTFTITETLVYQIEAATPTEADDKFCASACPMDEFSGSVEKRIISGPDGAEHEA